MVEGLMVATATETQVNLFDVRKPSLIVKQMSLRPEQNPDEINDIALARSDTGEILVASCDDSGSTLVQKVDKDLTITELHRNFNTKHQNICFKAMFSSNPNLLYTTGFDYKICLWNLKDPKKSQSTNLGTLLANEIGEKAMSYNPPFCFAWDTFLVHQQEFIVMGLGNGMLLRLKRTGLQCEEMHGSVH